MSATLNSPTGATATDLDASDEVLAEATADYVARLRAALVALHDDPLSLEAARNVAALL